MLKLVKGGKPPGEPNIFLCFNYSSILGDDSASNCADPCFVVWFLGVLSSLAII